MGFISNLMLPGKMWTDTPGDSSLLLLKSPSLWKTTKTAGQNWHSDEEIIIPLVELIFSQLIITHKSRYQRKIGTIHLLISGPTTRRRNALLRSLSPPRIVTNSIPPQGVATEKIKLNGLSIFIPNPVETNFLDRGAEVNDRSLLLLPSCRSLSTRHILEWIYNIEAIFNLTVHAPPFVPSRTTTTHSVLNMI